MNRLLQSPKSTDVCKAYDSYFSSSEISELTWNTKLEPSTTTFSGESRYLAPLRVSRKEGAPEELHQSDSSQSRIIEDKIRAALKLLAFRREHVLVQFWSPRLSGKFPELTTVDRPYGLGTNDNGLFSYRKYSEVYPLGQQEYDFGPPARVFRDGLPEWTSDLTKYSSKDFPPKDFAIHCNLYGYLALPVFDSRALDSTVCVGVLEFLTSSGYTSFAYEVQQIHKALKGKHYGYNGCQVVWGHTWTYAESKDLRKLIRFLSQDFSMQSEGGERLTENLTSPRAFDCPALNVSNEHRQNESTLHEIRSILQDVCDIHGLPLAQVWVATPSSSFVPFKKVLGKSCSSFDTRCIGKVCMTSTYLPFYVREHCMWPYRQASKKRHLEKSRGVVGTAFSSRGSFFCRDLTKLNEEEYPLVHHARMNKITGCLAIFLHSVEGNDDYVLEFVLPLDMMDGGYVSLTKTLKQKFEVASRFELGDTSTDLSVYIKHDIIQTSSNCMAENSIFHSDSSASESIMTDIATTDSASFPDQSSTANRSAVNIDAREKCNPSKQGIKRKIESDPLPSAISNRTFDVTFENDTEKFQFDTSLGLSTLKSDVAQRFKLNGKDFHLKYWDEDNDLILIAVDADLKHTFATLDVYLLNSLA